MKKGSSAFWDFLPFILIFALVLGSLFFVDFTGNVVVCEYDDCDDDGLVNDYDGCYDDNAPQGLVSYWAFEEDIEDIAYDSYVGQNDAYFVTDKEPLIGQFGKVGNAYLFDSTKSNHLLVINHESLQFSEEFSIMFWMKRSPLLNLELESIITKISPTSGYGVFLLEDGTLRFSTRRTTNPLHKLEGSTNVVDTTWHHVAIVKTENEKIIYVDGEIDASEIYSYDLGIGYTQFYIGKHPSFEHKFYYSGGLDEVAVFDRALTSVEVESFYLGGESYCFTCIDGDGDSYEDLVCGGTDCDDTNPEIYPGAIEIIDGIDNDCDGDVDEGFCLDGDTQPCGSDVGVCEFGEQTCELGIWGDCVSTVEAGDELCDDGLDNNCDGYIDEVGCDEECFDLDLDSYEDLVCGGTDCDDTNPEIYPGATEVCDDGLDNNCDGDVDEVSCLEGEVECFTGDTFWYNADGDEILTSAESDDVVKPLVYTDASCSGLEVNITIYEYGYDEDDTNITILESVEGIAFDNDGDGVDDTLYYFAEWDIGAFNLSDDYFVFNASIVDESVESSYLKVCANLSDCNFGVNVTDAEEEEEEEEEEEDCASQWDCSMVSWSDCNSITSTRTRDLSLCVQPSSEECLDDFDSYPDSVVSCIVEEEEEEEEEVPVFTWINMLLVVSVLIGYYFKRR